LKDVQALQEQVQQTIARAEPSIACVLVSRSELYKKFGAAPNAENPGKLGPFDARTALLAVPETDEPRKRLVKGLDLANPDNPPESFGSGVVLDDTGLILTAAHVVQNATKVYVRLPGNRGSYADIHALDPRSDLAVLKLLNPPANLQPLKLG